MGCTASKLDNDDTVRRCKERARFMKEAVYARNHLAAAHSDYCRSLRVIGSALSAFAAGEPLAVSDNTPAILLHNPSLPRSRPRTTHIPSTNSARPRVPSPSPSPSLHEPQPPSFSPSPSPTIASSKPPHILAASSLPSRHHRNHRKKPIKVPHILSESSVFGSSPQSDHNSNFNHHSKQKDCTYDDDSNYSSTPSQASSVWNWENFYPPSPPDSEFFQQNRKNKDNNDDDTSSVFSSSTYSTLHKSNNLQDQDRTRDNLRRHHHLDSDSDSEERERERATEREEVHCSEWGDHYSTTTSSSDEEEEESRSEIGSMRSNLGSSVHNYKPKETPVTGAVNPKSPDDAGSSVSWNAGKSEFSSSSDKKIVVRHKDLAEIVDAIKEFFDKAASAGEQISEMLETGRAQLDRSFTQLKKTVYHSSGVLSNLSSSWTSKPPLAVKYRFEPGSMDETGGPKSLCSTLERLLAWEKKLYQEVKAQEGAKIEHERKLSALQSQEYKGNEDAKLDKTKASIKRLQSLILVTSQAVSTTSSAITGLRDTELVPQLVELCHGSMYMWRSMNQFHEVQNDIVQQVRGLINRSAKGESTTDLHRQATRDLESAVSAWHSSFCHLVKFQRDFIRSLHGWFKLTLHPVNIERTNGGTTTEPSEAFVFCDEWKLTLDRLPDTVASEAIKSFINVVQSTYLKQTEELKIQKRTESASKELEKKASALRNIEKKYYHSYSMVGIGLPDSGHDNGHVLDARDPLAEKKSELAACQKRVEDEMVRHSRAVELTRSMTLNNIQTGLPGVFQAMTSFSALIMEALEVVCNRSYAIK
ncbi:unnamed protein product [Ilex paraguariensis]|uniref:Uncharacterized protein n=1 Tax=Ilex paraguariensis TaxID=185542 RepID=A0ABC8RWZ5_9AQUA